MLCILVASFVGVAPAALSEIFPAGVRSTGTSLVYNGAFTLFGGFAPMILTWAKQQSAGSIYAPAWYVMGAAGLALLAIPFLGRASTGRQRSDMEAKAAAAVTQESERLAVNETRGV
jgi:MHS family proline/betaine transporter-like MFS transporter